MPLLDFLKEISPDEVILHPHQEKLLDAISEGKRLVINQPRRYGTAVLDELIRERTNGESKYRPIGKYPVFCIVSRKDGKVVSHWSCEEPDVEEFKNSSIKRGNLVEVFPHDEYWEKYKRGEFNK